jgi:hypothetical protein
MSDLQFACNNTKGFIVFIWQHSAKIFQPNTMVIISGKIKHVFTHWSSIVTSKRVCATIKQGKFCIKSNEKMV